MRSTLRTLWRRLGAVARRVWADGFTPDEYRKVCWAALLMLAAIVVSGAAVRLTGSGLGCSDWPRCNDERLVDVTSAHAAIEQINRLFTFVVSLAVALAALGAWRRVPRRRDLTMLATAIVIGVPAQGLVGAIVVWAELHPATVQLHFVLSMILVSLAVTLIVRAGQPDTGTRIHTVSPRLRRRVRAVVVSTAISVLAGTVVTGSGPHAGDTDARRFGSPSTTEINGDWLRWMTRLHSVAAWITVIAALRVVWHVRGKPRERRIVDGPLVAWAGVVAAQIFVGYLQYFSGLPAALVGVHVAMATTLWAITSWMATTMTRVSTV